jgi:hypothetical protein
MRISFDQLEPSDDHLVLMYQGQPFSGTAIENDGGGVSETTYKGGQRNGLSKAWSPSGGLVREETFAFDALHGRSREWYEDGRPRKDGTYELGVCLSEKEWDSEGQMVRDFRLSEASPQFALLEKLRKSRVGQQVAAPSERPMS